MDRHRISTAQTPRPFNIAASRGQAELPLGICSKAFSGEVDAGSPRKTRQYKKPGAPFRFHRNGSGSRLRDALGDGVMYANFGFRHFDCPGHLFSQSFDIQERRKIQRTNRKSRSLSAPGFQLS
jgi:hypothetical protein